MNNLIKTAYTYLFPQKKSRAVLPHRVLERLGHFPVREAQHLVSWVNDRHRRTRDDVNPDEMNDDRYYGRMGGGGGTKGNEVH